MKNGLLDDSNIITVNLVIGMNYANLIRLLMIKK